MYQLLSKFLSICLVLLLSISTSYANDNWQLEKAAFGIKVYTRPMQGSAIREIKGEVVINSSLDSIMAVFDDVTNYPAWNHQCSKAYLLNKINKNERYHYQNIKMPFPMLDRDLLIRSTISQLGKQIVIQLQATPNYCKNNSIKACKTINQSKQIIVKKLRGLYQLTPLRDHKVKVVWIQHTEPAGKIPNWLVNNMLVDVPFNTLKKLSKQVTKKPYQDAQLKRDVMGKILGVEY